MMAEKVWFSIKGAEASMVDAGQKEALLQIIDALKAIATILDTLEPQPK